jgi:hypothetical protein
MLGRMSRCLLKVNDWYGVGERPYVFQILDLQRQ